jgi:3-oxoacyl-[acyl-carrier-protein] synthase-3
LAKESIRQTIQRAQIEPSNVDAVVLCTSSYWYFDQLRSDQLGKMLCEVGLGSSNIIVSSVMGCHNAVTAIRLGHNLIRAEGKSSVICVTSDLAAIGDSRLSEGQTVLGDGAASCLLSTTSNDGYAIVDIAQLDRNHMYKYTNSGSDHDFAYRAQEWLDGIAEVSNLVLSRNDLQAADIGLVLNNNYNTVFSQLIAACLGIKENVQVPFNPNIGHVWSSDTLIGIESTHKTSLLNVDDYILIIGSGNSNFGAVLLQKYS